MCIIKSLIQLLLFFFGSYHSKSESVEGAGTEAVSREAIPIATT